jgi:TrmH family RNA methyltransferase
MKLEDVKKLHQKKYRNQFKHYLVEGEHLVLELVKALGDTDASITLYVTEDYVKWAEEVACAFNIQVVTERQMAQISDTKTPQGIIACVPLPDNKTVVNRGPASKYIYLHEVQDPGNLGTILRSLAWFDNFSLILSPNSVDPFNSKVVRASMGAIFHVPIEVDVSLDTLESRFSEFAYLDMQGKAISDRHFNAYQCYLFGNEARGVPREALTRVGAHAFTIAGSGKIDSLNLASAVNICVYQLSQ